MADAPTSFGSTNGHSAPPAARPAQCVLLHRAQRPTPETLVRTFAARGVEVCIEHEPILALAELGRRLVEHRQRVAQHATFHSRGDAQSPQPHPSLIFVIVEPREFDEVDELIAAIARSMPLVTVSSFEGGANSGLRLLQRGGSESQPAPRAARVEPAPRSHGSRPGLRLTPDDRPVPPAPPAPVAQPAPWLTDADDDPADRPNEPHDESSESLISQAELAMLLGDDYAFGDDPNEEERQP